MKTTIIVILLLIIPISIVADSDIGRYQVIRIDGNATFIIDTKEGHLWVWAVGEGMMKLMYVGKVKPGKKMGDTIAIQTWTN